MNIVAIESSCDESAVAVFDPERGLIGEWVHSQVVLHGRHGGVVPDLAAREHLRNLPPLLARLRDSGAMGAGSRVAVTCGPGLAPCLALGVAAAKALSAAKGVPLQGANHLRGHAWSPFIAIHAEGPAQFRARMGALLPHLGLIVSGGHTLIFEIDAEWRVRELGSTLDDAAGEALDKGGKLLGLGYPGGPFIEREASGGEEDAFAFPRALPERGNLDFSFSGLKTSLRTALERMAPEEIEARRGDLCASYLRAVVDALCRRARAGLEDGVHRSLGLSGGVARNASLRLGMAEEARLAGVPFFAAAPDHCGDNAGMIAFAAWADPDAAAAPGGAGLRIRPDLGLA